MEVKILLACVCFHKFDTCTEDTIYWNIFPNRIFGPFMYCLSSGVMPVIG